MQGLFDFNHIDPSIDKETQEELKNFTNITTNFGGATRKQWNDLKKLILLSISFPSPLSRLAPLLGLLL